MNQKLSLVAMFGLLTTIGNVAAAATIDDSFATTVPTTMTTAAASDSPPNMILLTAAGLLCALFCVWRGCERNQPLPATLNGHHPASEPPQS